MIQLIIYTFIELFFVFLLVWLNWRNFSRHCCTYVHYIWSIFLKISLNFLGISSFQKQLIIELDIKWIFLVHFPKLAILDKNNLGATGHRNTEGQRKNWVYNMYYFEKLREIASKALNIYLLKTEVNTQLFPRKLLTTTIIQISSLTHFRPMFPFYTPWKRQKTSLKTSLQEDRWHLLKHQLL